VRRRNGWQDNESHREHRGHLALDLGQIVALAADFSRRGPDGTEAIGRRTSPAAAVIFLTSTGFSLRYTFDFDEQSPCRF
jgi:hypothetical protein